MKTKISKKLSAKQLVSKSPAKTVQLFKLENGIKIPKQVHAHGANPPTKVWLTLQAAAVGQSFLINSELEALKGMKVVMDFNGREKKKAGGKHFSCRKVKNGLRVWRVK